MRNAEHIVVLTFFIENFSLRLSLFFFFLQLHEAADIIQKLHLIAQELPYGKYDLFFIGVHSYVSVLFCGGSCKLALPLAFVKSKVRYSGISHALWESVLCEAVSEELPILHYLSLSQMAQC